MCLKRTPFAFGEQFELNQALAAQITLGECIVGCMYVHFVGAAVYM